MKTRTSSITVAVCLLLLIFASIATGCRKSHDPADQIENVYPEENPLPAFYAASGLTKIYEELGVDHYESGLKFSPTVKGKINAITLRLPEATNHVKLLTPFI